MLIILSGLPGVGKTAIARELARQTGAVHVRIDSIEQALRDSGLLRGPIDDAGYRAGYAIAQDNVTAGLDVIADCVNPIPITRDAWASVALRARVRAVAVEIVCSDQAEHRRRVETRRPDIRGLELPTWADVIARDYRPSDRDRIVIDTVGRSVRQSVRTLRAAIASAPTRGRRRSSRTLKVGRASAHRDR